jgi:TPR repeat protein
MQEHPRAAMGVGSWKWVVVAAVVLVAAVSRPAAAQDWDTNKLVNEAHNLAEGDLVRVRQQADGGDPHAQALLGLAYEMGAAGLMADAVQALAWFNKLADQGIAWGELWAGDFYYTGSQGVPKDLYKASELYKSAASHGEPKAAFYVGRMYFFGEGVALNMKTAAEWFRRALPADPDLVGRMVALSENDCETAFCMSLRQILGAMTT